MTEDNSWRIWARSDKAIVHEMAVAYAGSFVKAMVESFMFADTGNTEKLLDTFSKEFKHLYSFYLREEEE